MILANSLILKTRWGAPSWIMVVRMQKLCTGTLPNWETSAESHGPSRSSPCRYRPSYGGCQNVEGFVWTYWNYRKECWREWEQSSDCGIKIVEYYTRVGGGQATFPGPGCSHEWKFQGGRGR